MALQAVYEVALHFGTFRNVDLFYQGIYHVQCRVFEDNEGTPVNAVPHCFQPECTPRGPLDHVLPAAVLDPEAAFRTKSVLVRYCEEQLELDDLAVFRVERACGEDCSLMVEVQLMFAEAPMPSRNHASQSEDGSVRNTVRTTGGSPRIGASPQSECGSPPRRGSLPGPSDFIAVSSQKLRLHEVTRGIHAYCPVSFDEMHFCKVELMVHSSLLDYRLRIRTEVPPTPLAALQRRSQTGPAALAGALVELAVELAAAEVEVASQDCAGPNSSRAGGPEAASPGCGASPMANSSALASPRTLAETMSLAEAADLLQRRCVARLLSSHADLATFLQDLAADRRWPPDSPCTLPSARLPGREGPEAAKWPSGLIPISARLGDPGKPAAAAAAARLLTEDLNFVSAQVHHAWRHMLQASTASLEAVVGLLEARWDENLVRFWEESIYCRTSPVDAVASHIDEETASLHAHTAAELRLSPSFLRLRPHEIEDLAAVPPPQERPVMFEQRYGQAQDIESNPNGIFTRKGVQRPAHCGDGLQPYEGVHVFVLVHGFQGTSFDLRLMKDNVALLFPTALCLCSVANEDCTEGNIEHMGERLAAEVRTFIQDWCSGSSSEEGSEPPLGRLSFVTHSVGGLIARAALPLLAEHHERMHTFLSLSSPHLGYLYSPNSLFKAGLWVAKRLKKSKCLEQLSMTDAADPGSCFLSRMSELPGLEHFQHVVLVSSYQDQYAPFESARMEMPRVAEADSKLGPCYAKMLRSLLDPIKAERIIRIHVDFHIPDTSIDTVIGRTAHIQFIESQPLLKMLVQTHGFLFE